MTADKISEDPIYFSCLDEVNIFKIDGRGSMNNVHLFVSMCDEIIKFGKKRIVVDFGNCIGLDSTFMGSLVEIDDKLHAIDGELILIQVSDKVKVVLNLLGVLEIVKITNDLKLPDNLKFEKINNFQITDMERIKLIHSAHKKLVESNPENIVQFGDFLTALESELNDM
ncbi:MAG: hypothetical protein COA79_11480 [Planctomycetota bacterium]|nr:MAG: hypothetical protein COA79_11480 [Planctomycetota bacterium]